MDPLIHEYAARLDIIRTQAREAVRGLDSGALNWTPLDQETNSVAALVHHMWGLERFFIRQVVGGYDIGRDRDAEFAAEAPPADELERLLDEARKDTEATLRALRDDQLAEQREHRGNTWTVQGLLLYATSHLSEHLGHLELTRQMYQDRAGERP